MLKNMFCCASWYDSLLLLVSRFWAAFAHNLPRLPGFPINFTLLTQQNMQFISQAVRDQKKMQSEIANRSKHKRCVRAFPRIVRAASLMTT